MPQSPQNPIDYDALAEQARQVRPGGLTLSGVDYDALANEVRQQTAAETPTERPRDAVGFLNNLVISGGRFVRDTAQGVWDLGRFGARLATAQAKAQTGDPSEIQQLGREFATVIQNAPEIGHALVTALGNRYGSTEALLKTLYEDPVGVLADVSTVAGGGALVAGTRAPRVAAQLARVERLTNPVTYVAGAVKAGAKAADLAGDTAIGLTVRPGAAVKKAAGTPNRPAKTREIARAIRQERVATSEGAERRLQESIQRADALLAEREAAGTPGVSAQHIADALSGEPSDMAARRADLGVGDAGAAVAQRRADILARFTEPARPGTTPTRIETPAAPDSVDAAIRATNELGTTQAGLIPDALFAGPDPSAVAAARQLGPQANLVPRRLLGTSQTPGRMVEMGGDVAPVPPTVQEIPLTRAQALKREAQDLAYEAGKGNQSVDAAANTAIARAFRSAIEQAVPDVAPINERSQRLLTAKRALEAAEERPAALSRMLIVPTLGTSMLFDSPAIGSALGIALGDAARGARTTGSALSNPVVRRGALGARLVNDSDELFQLLLEQALQQDGR